MVHGVQDCSMTAMFNYGARARVGVDLEGWIGD
jgi:hypothetical protein